MVRTFNHAAGASSFSIGWGGEQAEARAPPPVANNRNPLLEDPNQRPAPPAYQRSNMMSQDGYNKDSQMEARMQQLQMQQMSPPPAAPDRGDSGPDRAQFDADFDRQVAEARARLAGNDYAAEEEEEEQQPPRQLTYAEQLRADVEEKKAMEFAAKQQRLAADRADEERIQYEQAILMAEKQQEIDATRNRQRQVEERDAHSLAQHNERNAAKPDREEQIRRLQEQAEDQSAEPWAPPPRVGSKPVKRDDYHQAAPSGSTSDYFENRVNTVGDGGRQARKEQARKEQWEREHGGGGPIKTQQDMQTARAAAAEERDRRNQAAYQERMNSQGGITREDQIRALQEKQAPDLGFSPSVQSGGKRTKIVSNAVMHVKDDDYYAAKPAAGTQDYFSSRLEEEENPHKARLREMRERRYQNEALGEGAVDANRENVINGAPSGKAQLGRMPGGGSSINLSWG